MRGGWPSPIGLASSCACGCRRCLSLSLVWAAGHAERELYWVLRAAAVVQSGVASLCRPFFSLGVRTAASTRTLAMKRFRVSSCVKRRSACRSANSRCFTTSPWPLIHSRHTASTLDLDHPLRFRNDHNDQTHFSRPPPASRAYPAASTNSRHPLGIAILAQPPTHQHPLAIVQAHVHA